MSTFLAGFFLVAVAQVHPPLDVRWLPELGLVTLSADGPRIAVRMEKDGAKTEHAFEIPGFAAEDRILEARCGLWLGEEMVIALAIRHGDTTSYPYVLSALRKPEGRDFDAATSSGFVDPERHWFLTRPLFTSTGEPFRIVAVNDHDGRGDSLEITFRRGWIKRLEDSAKIEEKILFDSCGGFALEPLRNGRAVLYETPGSPR